MLFLDCLFLHYHSEMWVFMFLKEFAYANKAAFISEKYRKKTILYYKYVFIYYIFKKVVFFYIFYLNIL